MVNIEEHAIVEFAEDASNLINDFRQKISASPAISTMLHLCFKISSNLKSRSKCRVVKLGFHFFKSQVFRDLTPI